MINGDENRKKLGMFSWYGINLPIKERLQNIKKAGFDSTMLWWGDEVAFWEYKKEDLVRTTLETGLSIENIHGSYLKCNDLWSNDESSEFIVDVYKRWIKDCYTFNIPALVIHIENNYFIPESIDNGLKNINRILNESEKLGVELVIENTRNEKLLDIIFKEINSKKLKFCYDSSHDWLTSKKKGRLILDYKDKIKYLHLSDNDGIKDKHWIPGDGVVDFTKIKEYLNEAEFKGNISFEVCPTEENMIGKDILDKIYKFGLDFTGGL